MAEFETPSKITADFLSGFFMLLLLPFMVFLEP